MNCSIEDCTKTVEKRGWCGMHYRRWQRHGDPLTNRRPEMVIGPVAMRFWAKVGMSGGDDACWPWLGWRLPSGYGHFNDNRRTWLAHRFAYTLEKGAIPKGMEIHHICVKTFCVNPRHLEVVTHAENLHRSPDVQFKRNAAKTHCKHGHPFDEANTYVRAKPNGRTQRVCRKCVRVAQAKHRHGTVVVN